MSDDQSLLSRRDQLAAMLGITSVSVVKHPSALALNDTVLA